MKKQTIEEIFSRFKENKPNPRIELEYYSPYTLLIAVVLSAQSTDKGVNKATPALFEIADTPEEIVKLGEEGLKKYIKTIGLYNAKAKNIIALSKELILKYKGEVPNEFEELIKLPGVGRKSAKVLLHSIWNRPVMAVDTHVFRVANRIGLCQTKNVLQTELELEKIIPIKWLYKAHHWLVLHGRYVCKARKPECQKCLINDLCEYEFKTV
jgi:endonuclease III